MLSTPHTHAITHLAMLNICSSNDWVDRALEMWTAPAHSAYGSFWDLSGRGGELLGAIRGSAAPFSASS